jgi:cell division protein FtsB
MNKRLIRRWLTRLSLAGVLAVGTGYLPYKAYGPGGVAKTLRLEKDLKGLQEGNLTLREENQQLLMRIKSLKEDRAAIEQVARDELGLVRSEDVVFQFE